MTIPSDIIIFLGITLIASLLGNAVSLGLWVAHFNTERDRLYHERKMKNKVNK